jgi:hypothetical protein
MSDRRSRTRRLLVSVFACLGILAPAGVAHATWTADNCYGSGSDMTAWRRSQAYVYVQQAAGEGYEWGGGCFKLNDVDDTPFLPTDGDGEGTDCSGLVFKTWALRNDGTSGFKFWPHEKEIHGPYNTASYYSPASADPFKTISKSYKATIYMDAFVHRDADGGHIALINAEGSSGSDWLIHSYTNTAGTLIEYRDYRSQSIYRAVMRKNWTPDCYPRCV